MSFNRTWVCDDLRFCDSEVKSALAAPFPVIPFSCILAPSRPCPICPLQTAAVSTAFVTTARAVAACASGAHVPQASAAPSAMSLWRPVGPQSWPSAATHTPAVSARGAPAGEDSGFLPTSSVTAVVQRLTEGSAHLPRCLCLDGFEGDGFSCTPSNPCSRPDRGGCAENVSQVSLPGSPDPGVRDGTPLCLSLSVIYLWLL